MITYNYYQQLKYFSKYNYASQKNNAEYFLKIILETEKQNPEWLYKICREYIDVLIKE